MIISIFSIAIGIFLFLFLFWQKLKEDYNPERIFSTAFLSLLGILIGSLVSQKLFPTYWFWGVFTSFLLFLSFSIMKYKLRFFETLEAGVFATLPWLSILFLVDAIKTYRQSSLIGFLLFLVLIGIFVFLDTKYKGFSWYKSGRVGFTGLTILGLSFLVRAILTIFFQDVLSLAGSVDIILSSIVSFVSFLLLFNLSRKI